MAEGCRKHVCDKVKEQPGAGEGCHTNGAEEGYRSLNVTERLGGFYQWTVVTFFV